MRRVVIAGASGFIGQRLVEAYRSEGAEVMTIGRDGADARWGDEAAIRALLDGAALLVNLAGRSVNCRYTAKNRAVILNSRVDTTAQLSRAIRACATPPPLWINSSTATIYRHAADRAMTEADGELGEGFSVRVAKAWEQAFLTEELPATRRVALRIAIVLGNGSVIPPLLRLVRFGLGGAQRDGHWFSTPARRAAGTFHEYRATHGRQKFSWVHIDDVVGVIRFVEADPRIEGVLNVSSPNPSDSASLMALLRKKSGMWFGLPAFRWMLELGSFVIRTETELVLKSRWVIPARLSALGFTFRHPNLDETLDAILLERRGSH